VETFASAECGQTTCGHAGCADGPTVRDKHAIVDQLCAPRGLHGDCIRSSSGWA